VSTCGSAYQSLPPSVLREHTVDMGFKVKPMISGLLRAQVKILSKWISVLWLVNLIVITIRVKCMRGPSTCKMVSLRSINSENAFLGP
jgi:hypothetical protein